MANKTFAQLPAAAALTAGDILPLMQSGSGATSRTTLGALDTRFNPGQAISVEAQSGWDPIAANNDSAVAAAVAAAEAAGGGTVLIPRLLKISARLVTTHGVDLVGLGSLPGAHAQSKILCTAAGSGVSFGLDTAGADGVVGAGGGTSGAFSIDGNNVALNPMRCAVGTRTYRNIDIENAVEDGLLLAATQNSLFVEVNVGGSNRDNIVLDRGAGGNHFLKCENHTAGRAHLAFRASAVGAGGVAFPLYNEFDNMIMEYTEASGGPMVQHGAGRGNVLRNCQVVANDPLSTMAVPAMVRVARDFALESSLVIDGGVFVKTGTGAAGLRAFDVDALADLAMAGFVAVGGMGICYRAASNATIREVGEVSTLTLVAPATLVETTPTALRRYTTARKQSVRATGDAAYQVFVPGESNARWSLFGSGHTWYAAGATGLDTNLYRKGAGVVGTDHSLGPGAFTTAARPAATVVGQTIFDTTLGCLISWNGSVWKNGVGTTV